MSVVERNLQPCGEENQTFPTEAEGRKKEEEQSEDDQEGEGGGAVGGK